ncbi:2,3-diaminopropionate biosynthesis protein SbnA [Rhodococcus qingshengii]|uniref:2,3-diaminopropionate biosynthesis protein SbnA n=1 Tax=Rhodococcus qingshengii TaxID=334542 RepID=UPI0036DAFADD
MAVAPPVADGVLDAIGATPLIQFRRLFRESGARFYGKLEAANPAGSVKDRAAAGMLTSAIAEGHLVPGVSTVVESSSGNLGIGLAQACRLLGLSFVCVVDRKTTVQNLAILRAYGADVSMVTEAGNDRGDYLMARLRRVQELLADSPTMFWPDQYANLRNAEAQEAVMREVTAQLEGRVDYLFAATGTCGTLRGCARHIAEQGLQTHLVAVDAVGSAIFGDVGCSRLVPGHGAAVRPPLYMDGLADSVVQMTDQDCVVGCRRLIRTEAVLCGGSSGAVVSAAAQWLDVLPHDANCVLLLPDRGERYLDTIYSDTWVQQNFGEIAHLWNERVRTG